MLRAMGFTAWMVGFYAACADVRLRADDVPAHPATVGQFVTITSPIDDIVYHRVSNAALKLQTEAAQTGKKTVLVLQLQPGVSPLHQVQGLAKFLTSPTIQQVHTVAWIPEKLTGPHVILALACREIVMPDDVELGDISRGAKLDPEDEQAALAIGQKRMNSKVSTAIVHGLLDAAQELWRIRTQSDTGMLESRIVTRSELEDLRRANTVIEDATLIKEAGTPGIFTGKAARNWDLLVTHAAESRLEVCELYGLPREAQREPGQKKEWNQVRIIRIQGQIDTMLESFLSRQIHQAEEDGVQIILFELDATGGQLLASINLAFVIAELNPDRIHTAAFIRESAFGGSAVVAMACDDVFMQPTARWGSATPSQGREAEQFDRSPEKISQVKVALQKLAVKKNRPSGLAEAMADRKLVVYQTTHAESGRTWFLTGEELHASSGEWNQGPEVPEANGSQTLIVDGRRAAELKLAEPTVDSFDEMKSRLGIPETVKLSRAEPTWVDHMVFWLNRQDVTMVLLIVAITMLYLEAHFPTTLFGILSLLCFSLFFWSHMLGGTAGSLEVILFVIGLGCLGMEIFVVPGFGVFGVTGILLVLSSLVMAIQTFGNLEPNADWNQMAGSLGTVFLALLLMVLAAVGLSRVLPSMPFMEQMILSPPGEAEQHAQEPRLRQDPADQVVVDEANQVGERGVALTILRPAGKARFDGRLVDVISDGGYIPAGSPVEIMSVTGKRIVVRHVS